MLDSVGRIGDPHKTETIAKIIIAHARRKSLAQIFAEAERWNFVWSVPHGAAVHSPKRVVFLCRTFTKSQSDWENSRMRCRMAEWPNRRPGTRRHIVNRALYIYDFFFLLCSRWAARHLAKTGYEPSNTSFNENRFSVSDWRWDWVTGCRIGLRTNIILPRIPHKWTAVHNLLSQLRKAI